MLTVMNTKKTIAFLLLMVFSIISFSQLHDGGEPFNRNWQEINTNDFRIIYDEGMDSIAQNMSRLFHYMHDHNDRSIGPIKRKLNVVLHNHTSVVNSAMVFGPYHCEQFVSTSPQNTMLWGPDDWNVATPIHEYRHALQYSNSVYGYGKLFNILFGDGHYLFRGALVPGWFTEGDAVVQETALTNGGRGRIPIFSEAQRAQLFSNIKYSYAKAKNGSFKDESNSIYELGFQMANYARNQYGNDAWRPALERSYQLKRLIYPLSSNFKKLYGINTKTLYKEAYKDLKMRYQHLLDSVGYIENENLFPATVQKYPTFFNQPLFNSEGKLFALRSSYDKNAQIVEINNGKATTVCVVGKIQDSNYFDEYDGKFIWSEQVSSIRRGYVNYMQVVEYDAKTKKRRYITSETNAQSPSFSAKGDKIVFVEADSKLKNYLVIIDANSGLELDRIETSFLPTFPKFYKNDNSIIYSASKNGRAFIGSYDLTSSKFQKLTIPTFYAIGKPIVNVGKVYFTATFSGINNVYVYEIESGEIHQITSAKIGLKEPVVSPSGNALVVSERVFSKGTNLTKVDLTKGYFKENIQLTPNRDQVQDSVVYALREINKEGGSIVDKLPDTVYPSSKYQKGKHLIHPYFWSLLYDNDQLGGAISFNNVLSTIFINGIYSYDFNKETGIIKGFVEYYGFYPVLRGEWNQVQNKNFIIDTPSGERKLLYWNEKVFLGKATLPFDLSRHQFSRHIDLSASYSFSNINFSEEMASEDYNIHALKFQLNASNSRLFARSKLSSKYSQRLSVIYNQSLSDQSNQLFIGSTLKFPGFTPTNSFGLSGFYESREIGDLNYIFNDNFSNSRGYFDARQFDSQYKLSLNYGHPVWYPDFGIHGLVYMKRLRANYFFDYTRVFYNEMNKSFSSAGIEVKLDCKFYDKHTFVLGGSVNYLIDPLVDGKYFEFNWTFYY